MNDQIEHSNQGNEPTDGNAGAFDYTYVQTVARIAQYDDLRSAPRITEIQPAPTADFIEHLASKIYEQAKMAGGTIPYTVMHGSPRSSSPSLTRGTPSGSPTRVQGS